MILDVVLNSLCNEVGYFANTIVIMVLGLNFLWNENTYSILKNIISWFLASLSNLKGEQVNTYATKVGVQRIISGG
jgi:hypothetical protein